ncbi:MULTISPECIES: hexitol phosphatase HxpB [Providencia]|uniref:Hexitol phosphatase HxpB n=1 Tax=Providencia rettgeri TaxID=587 RepID=A0A2U9L703_PRORE|nr:MULTISPECIES: hexitol phosphatase HxpB [Providencia]AWS51377.1 hexitol phosphatase HxpB [Providencia rettgeri]EJD6377267.1 hexitol phosphatase HxpB [Providencia rettgeri]EJD6474022.1 hexitol phosphatase HxpB [Providencia rettgeri]EJD6477936.1 hexitol phosphatase HxpB [Providencia rettgeri]EJF7711771.1 hexitol phosphatase HxpB [Providencia rettgeri]
MYHNLPIQSVIFDMDGLLIDSEPFWAQAELEIFSQLGVDVSIADTLPDTLGLRIDHVVELWYHASPWQGCSQEEATQRIIDRVVGLVEETRPILPGVQHAMELCRSMDLKIALASASPLYMLEKVLNLLDIRDYFSAVISAADLPLSKPHPEVYLKAAAELSTKPVNCASLEDSFNGMISAKAARMRSIVVPDSKHFNDPRFGLADIKLASLNDLKAEHLR